jgi:hypothetical protein
MPHDGRSTPRRGVGKGNADSKALTYQTSTIVFHCENPVSNSYFSSSVDIKQPGTLHLHKLGPWRPRIGQYFPGTDQQTHTP